MKAILNSNEEIIISSQGADITIKGTDCKEDTVEYNEDCVSVDGNNITEKEGDFLFDELVLLDGKSQRKIMKINNPEISITPLPKFSTIKLKLNKENCYKLFIINGFRSVYLNGINLNNSLIQTSKGSVYIAYTNGSADVRSESGTVHVNKSNGITTVTTNSGDINVSTSKEVPILRSSVGNIKLIDAKLASNSRISAPNGNVTIWSSIVPSGATIEASHVEISTSKVDFNGIKVKCHSLNQNANRMINE